MMAVLWCALVETVKVFEKGACYKAMRYLYCVGVGEDRRLWKFF